MMAVLKIAKPTCGIQSLAPGLANATVARIAKYKWSNFMAVCMNLIPNLLIRCPKMGWRQRDVARCRKERKLGFIQDVGAKNELNST